MLSDSGIGYPVDRDATHPQIEAKIDNLNVQKGSDATDKILGYAKSGFYYVDNPAPVVSGGYSR